MRNDYFIPLIGLESVEFTLIIKFYSNDQYECLQLSPDKGDNNLSHELYSVDVTSAANSFPLKYCI